MNRDDRKRQKKRRREKKKDRSSVIRHLQRDQYPVLVIEAEDGVHAAFREAVETAVARFCYDDVAICRPEVRYCYKVIRQVGWDKFLDKWFVAQTQGGQKATDMTHALQIMSQHLGSWLFDQVPTTIKSEALPYSVFKTRIGKESIVVHLLAIQKARGAGGNIYYSQQNAARPLPIAGGVYPLGFSKHAIDQICFRERNPNLSYNAAAYVHEVLSNWTCVEACQLCDGTPAVSLFAVCGLPTSPNHDLYVRRLLHVESTDWAKELFAYRLGYCPIVVDNGFAKAVTFLYPGYRNTRERRAIERSRDLAHSKRVKWLDCIENMGVDNLGNEEHGGVLEWFHRNAVTQVYRQGDVGKSASFREYSAPINELL